jgi:predicted phage tail protein
MVKIELHGILAEKLNKANWNLAINSVSEAIRAIEANTGILYKNLYELDKQNIKYRILINKKDFKIFKPEEEIKNDFDKVMNSNLLTSFEEQVLESIDIIPVLEGSFGGGGFFQIIPVILGIALIFTGVGIAASAGVFGLLAASLVVAGIGLAAVGFLALLSSPPPFVAPEFNAPNVAGSKSGGGKSYLFDGPTNTAGEGGPIPIGYGRLLIGSKTISATYTTSYIENASNTTTRTT